VNHRHPTTAERLKIAELLDSIGPVELLRVIGTWVRVQHPHAIAGDIASARLYDVANSLRKSWLEDQFKKELDEELLCILQEEKELKESERRNAEVQAIYRQADLDRQLI
jgi:hypothetical protein